MEKAHGVSRCYRGDRKTVHEACGLLHLYKNTINFDQVCTSSNM